MRRTIREQEPPRPSTRLSTMQAGELATVAKTHHAESLKLIHQTRGDLDWIVMKCLEKDRARRYETANGLASDILRHINCEPVVARPPSRLYEFQKTVRRHKFGFAAAALIGLVLLVATGISAWQAVRATRAQALAKERLAESEAVSKFLTEVFQSPDPSRDGRTITVAETLGAAEKKLETELASQPARRAKLQATLGSTYYALGLYPEAISLQEKVRDYYLATSGPEHPDTLQAMSDLANSYFTYYQAGHRDEALKLREQVLTVRRKVLGTEHPATIQAMASLAYSYEYLGHLAEAYTLREQVLTLRRKVLGPEHPDTLSAMANLADSCFETDRSDEALKLREQVLSLSRKVNGPEHPFTLSAMANLAYSCEWNGRPDEALRLQEEVVALSRKRLGPKHPDTVHAMYDLAHFYSALGRNQEAFELLEQACELDPNDTMASLTLATWQAWFNQGASYEATRSRLVQQAEGTDETTKADRAAKAACLRPSTNAVLLAKILHIAQRAVELGKSDQGLPWFQLGLGLAEYRNGQYAEAERPLSIAEQSNQGREMQATASLFRAMCLFRQGKPEEARKLFSQAEAQMPPLPKDESKPLVYGGPAGHNTMICWLAYNEAKALLEGPVSPVAVPSEPK